jgi:hypothetical protein
MTPTGLDQVRGLEDYWRHGTGLAAPRPDAAVLALALSTLARDFGRGPLR